MNSLKGVLLSLMLTRLALAQSIEVKPDTVLIEQRFQVALKGLKPDQEVRVRVDGNGGMFQSDTLVRAGHDGEALIADPMKLVWGAKGRAPVGGVGAAPQAWIFTAEAGQHVVADTLWRLVYPTDVRVKDVRENGLVGTLYLPPGSGPRPAMIVLVGSSGGIPNPAAHTGGLASNGYVVLALALFNVEGRPPLLNNIPVEYVGAAIEWLKAQAGVDSTRIGVLGTSRGAELALLAGATYPSLRVVVANAPSNVIWPGLSDDTETPAWTLDGKPLPAVPSFFTAADSVYSSRERFLRRMTNPQALVAAEIPVERIKGPVLLFSGKDDQVWPSDIFATRIVERLKSRHFTYAVEHHSYEDAGHLWGRPFSVTTNVREITVHRVSHRKTMFGGTPEGQAIANEDSWKRLLAFLDRYLRRQRP